MSTASGFTETPEPEEARSAASTPHLPKHPHRLAPNRTRRPVPFRLPVRAPSRLVIASNRMPITFARVENGEWTAKPASGGLVTALSPVMRRKEGIWVGWPGAADVGRADLQQALDRSDTQVPYELEAVEISGTELDQYYYGFCNGAVWPLFHGFPELCQQDEARWDAYSGVNRRFAQVLSRKVRKGDLIWVHDYHLMLVGSELRDLGVGNRTAFFLHIPFPPPELLRELPQWERLVRALLHFDLVGFQSTEDYGHFLAAAHALSENGGPAPGPAESGPRAGVFPISIDYEEFSGGGMDTTIGGLEGEIRREVRDQTLMLGVDRLDYTKGVPERLRGLDHALERYPELRGRIVLKQLVVPSREAVDAYAATKVEIEGLVAKINARWGRPDWLPVRYRYESWSRPRLLAHYREADVALVTPLRDGMNLVAKEFCATNPANGVLILSAFAGAASELGRDALLVDPKDPRQVADAIRRAHTMPLQERRKRMASMKEAVRRNDVYQWVGRFLDAAGEPTTHPHRPRSAASTPAPVVPGPR